MLIGTPKAPITVTVPVTGIEFHPPGPLAVIEKVPVPMARMLDGTVTELADDNADPEPEGPRPFGTTVQL